VDAEFGMHLARALRPGSTIGLVSPAGPVRDREAYEAGIRILHDFGLRIKECSGLSPCGDYLAADDEARAKQFNAMWADGEVDGLMCVRGGFGSLRMVESLDLETIRAVPKPFVGFSDISLLHEVIGRRTGLVTLHGPVLTSLAGLTEQSRLHLLDVLFGRMPKELRWKKVEILRPGTASGTLKGGNLATLCHLLSTPYEPDWQETVLFLEDVGETPYRIDRMLTQLQLAGKFKRLGALLLGSFTDCGDEKAIRQRAIELTEDAGIPLWANCPVGHGADNFTLPLGIPVTLSADGVLRFAAPCLLPASA